MQYKPERQVRLCLHQFFRPKISFPMDGYGDCAKCIYDEKNNPRCKGYAPIKVYLIENKQ